MNCIFVLLLLFCCGNNGSCQNQCAGACVREGACGRGSSRDRCNPCSDSRRESIRQEIREEICEEVCGDSRNTCDSCNSCDSRNACDNQNAGENRGACDNRNDRWWNGCNN